MGENIYKIGKNGLNWLSSKIKRTRFLNFDYRIEIRKESPKRKDNVGQSEH